jgi:tryptophan-rich hypothetical protein
MTDENVSSKPRRRAVPTKHLLGTQWTRSEATVGGRHFQVIALLAAQPKPWTHLRLEAVLTGRFIELERSELKDTELWSAGWQQIVTDEPDEPSTNE